VTLLILWLIFATIVGTCVGSFLNVVIYRLPEGLSLVHPPSRCPKCEHKLAWYDNVPVLGWCWLRGKCRYCGHPISTQYPIIEAITGGLIGGWFFICYFTNMRPDFSGAGLDATWVIFAVNAVLLAGLLAATLIDARYFIIPLGIPWTVTAVAVVVLPVAVALWPWSVQTVELPARVQGAQILTTSERLDQVGEPVQHAAAVQVAADQPGVSEVELSAAPLAGPRGATMALGAAIGLVLANVLLRMKLMPRSFDEEPTEVMEEHHEADDPESWLAHPHPRREVSKELIFLALPAAGAVIGWLAAGEEAGLVYRAFGGAMLGYLAGGLTVWATRILGTLGFGKEAMGLGDVHLMGAVGAVCGWPVAVLAFFVAPFLGLTWTAAAAGLSRMLNREVKMIPYGPHLAAATVVVMIFREPMLAYFGMLLAG